MSVAVGAPAIAQSQPTFNWRMATSWPTSLNILFGAAELMRTRGGKLINRKF